MGLTLNRRIVSVLSLLVLAGACGPAGDNRIDDPPAVQVAPPTGTAASDRPAILQALDRVQPGGTVQFAPGLYVVGEVVSVTTDRVTLLGHPEGTIFRGCDPDDYQVMVGRFEAALPQGSAEEITSIVRSCGSLELIGSGVTVRGFTFEHSRLGICTNSCTDETSVRESGGYIIEDNVFRNSANGVRPTQYSEEVSFIRNNIFVNTFHAVSGSGIHTHVIDNDISAPDPTSAPEHIVSFAIGLAGEAAGDLDEATCHDNVISGNRIDGHPDGIILLAFPGGECRQNTIRGNTISVSRPPRASVAPGYIAVANEDDSTAVGVPIQLYSLPGGSGTEAGRIARNLIEGNVILGAEGVGIEITRGSENRILDNELSEIRRRVPYPGNTLGWPAAWDDANGAAIWISPGSTGNEVRGNSFRSVAGPVVALEGNDNRVSVEPGESVSDVGDRNEVFRDGTPSG
jgi:parallel beta-helix repeat protein